MTEPTCDRIELTKDKVTLNMKRVNNWIMLNHERQQLDHVESWKNLFSQILGKDTVVSLFYVRKLYKIYKLKYYRDGEMVH